MTIFKYITYMVIVTAFNIPSTEWEQTTPPTYVKWEQKKLTENDFIKVRYMEDFKLAEVSTGIYVVHNKAFAIQVKSESRILGTLSKDRIPSILAHEQLHFDISQYFAKQLDSVLKTTVITDSLFYAYIAKKDRMQSLYDHQVYEDSTMQKVWSNKIHFLLGK